VENRIKELKDDLVSGRTSCHRFLAKGVPTRFARGCVCAAARSEETAGGNGVCECAGVDSAGAASESRCPCSRNDAPDMADDADKLSIEGALDVYRVPESIRGASVRNPDILAK